MTWTGKGAGWGQKPADDRPRLGTPGVIHYSPSQVKTFRGCNRKWAFKYIAGKPDRGSRYAKLGKYIHTQLERYLKDGWLESGVGTALELELESGKTKTYTHDDIVAIMLPGIQHLPTPGVAECEKGFVIPLGEIGEMIGFVDFRYQDQVPVVGDHKTTSNLSYALTHETIRQDVQANVYAKAETLRLNVDQVDARWVYYHTSKPRSQTAEARFSVDAIEPIWQGVLADCRTMYDLRNEAPNPNSVDCNLDECSAYGGCPYKELCRRSSGERIRSLFMAQSLLERMKAANAAAQPEAAPAPAPAVASQPPPASAPPTGAGQAINPPEGMSALERLKAQKAAQAAPTPAAPEPTPAPEPTHAPAVTQSAPPQESVVGAERTIDLYIDCAPNCEYLDFAQVAGPVLAEIKQQYGHHYKLIPDQYGGNGAILAEALAMEMDTNPVHGPVVVTLASPVVRDVLEVLQARARLIVRGF